MATNKLVIFVYVTIWLWFTNAKRDEITTIKRHFLHDNPREPEWPATKQNNHPFCWSSCGLRRYCSPSHPLLILSWSRLAGMQTMLQ